MSQEIDVLTALKGAGPCTYADLSKKTGIEVNKLRWTVNDLKKKNLLAQTEDALSSAVAWKITPKGLLHLRQQQDLAIGSGNARGLAQAAPAKKPASKTTKKKPMPARTIADVIEKFSPRKGATTPAAGGVNNSGSGASESPVGAATTSPEGTAGDDARAGSHDNPESAVGAADDPASSTVIETRTIFDCAGLPKAQISTIRITRPGILPPTNLKLAVEPGGWLTIGDHRFCPEEASLIGNFLAETNQIWSRS